jgi:hypothetical protein
MGETGRTEPAFVSSYGEEFRDHCRRAYVGGMIPGVQVQSNRSVVVGQVGIITKLGQAGKVLNVCSS